MVMRRKPSRMQTSILEAYCDKKMAAVRGHFFVIVVFLQNMSDLE